MKHSHSFKILALIFSLVCSPVVGRAEITVSLTKVFVQEFKDRATVSTMFRVDHHHDKPNPVGTGSKDGDIHIAGRDSVVRLPMVAEIINGRTERDTLDFILDTDPGQEVSVIGAWRFWFEHPGSENQSQTKKIPPVPDDTNPDHVFELHPIVQFGQFDCRDSFVPIRNGAKEFTGYPAETAFASYEKRPVEITNRQNKILITSNKADYNYANFEIRLAGKPKNVGDGYVVLANIYSVDADDEAQPVVQGARRMVFVEGTAPAEAVKKLKKGDRLRVLGIPRVNLNQVSAIASGLEVNDSYTAGWGNDECSVENPCLPYEMIIVALLK
jgi:hypothetical protein